MPVLCTAMSRQSNADLPGARIRQTREALGLSRIGLAYKAGVDLRTIERIEADAVVPRRATLAVIEQALAQEAAA